MVCQYDKVSVNSAQNLISLQNKLIVCNVRLHTVEVENLF